MSSSLDHAPVGAARGPDLRTEGRVPNLNAIDPGIGTNQIRIKTEIEIVIQGKKTIRKRLLRLQKKKCLLKRRDRHLRNQLKRNADLVPEIRSLVKRNAPNLEIGSDHGQGIRKGAGLEGSVDLPLKIEKDLVHGRGNVLALETVKDLNLEIEEGLSQETGEGPSLEMPRGQNQKARSSRGGPSPPALIKKGKKKISPKWPATTTKKSEASRQTRFHAYLRKGACLPRSRTRTLLITWIFLILLEMSVDLITYFVHTQTNITFL